jgi:hypothetical protein
MAYGILRHGPPGPSREKVFLPSVETLGLLTNRVTMARLEGLKNLRESSDVEAVDLIFRLPFRMKNERFEEAYHFLSSFSSSC